MELEWWGFGLFFAMSAYFVAAMFLSNKVASRILNLEREIQESMRLKEQLTQLKRDIKNPSTELTDFLADIRIHNCGAIRIDPDHIMVRSPRRIEE